MRIIAGKYKRTKLDTLAGEDITRPTKDMVKEALFSTIHIYSDTAFLDLFAGSGSIGIEALSRGSNNVVFNDVNKDACRIIRSNLNKIKQDCKVYNLDYQDCLNNLKQQFDYIYIDPPYDLNRYDNIFDLIIKNDLLSKDGIVIVEARKENELLDRYIDLSLYKEKRYGITKLLYYKRSIE